MFPKIDPTSTLSWNTLKEEFNLLRKTQMKDLFLEDPDRFKKFSIYAPDILVDFSKNLINDKVLATLYELATECELPGAIEAMFNAEKINETEERAVLHTALRNFSGKPVMVDGKDVMPDITAVQQQMKSFCERVHN